MRIGYVTLFPELIQPGLDHSILSRARSSGAFRAEFANPRDFATDAHRTVDDAPFGGGPGMVMMAPLLLQAARSLRPSKEAKFLIMDPRGEVFSQSMAAELSRAEDVIILCGHYEGMDERVGEILNARPVTIGDYVLTGGELPALVITDSIVRLLPGVLGDQESHRDDSHSNDGLLGFPLYTRPLDVEGCGVPEVLRSGHHGKISRWRRKQQLLATRQRRPDLFARASLRNEDINLLSEEN